MQALQIHKPDSSSIITIDPPSDLPPDHVMLKINTVGLCGTDLSTYRGVNPLVSYPRVPGHEIAATIEELGPEVPDTFAVGDTVTVYPYTNCGKCASCKNERHHACEHNATLGVQREGAFTERITQPWQKLIPAQGLTHAEAALIEPLSVGFHAVERGSTTSADTVLIIGCGAIGLGCIAGAAAQGATIIAADIDNTKLEIAEAVGATHTLNAGEAPLLDQVLPLTDNLGADVVIEAVGSPQTFTAAIDIVSYTGRVVYIGYSKAHVTYDTALFVKKELDIRGSRNATRQNFEQVITALRSGSIPTQKIITQTVTLQEAPQALDIWDKNGAHITKIHVQLDSSD